MKQYLAFTLLFALLLGSTGAEAQKLTKKLRKYTAEIVTEFDRIPVERQQILRKIGDQLINDMKTGERTYVLVICTHNSRRSHLSQLWMQTAASYYGISGLFSFSGGLEATAFNPNAIAALERAGFRISTAQPGDNPLYNVDNGAQAFLIQSRKYQEHLGVIKDFTAIMVCSDADQSCPVVEGARARFALPYNDPRLSDGSPSMEQVYDDSCREIAREMFFLMNYVSR